MTKTFKKELRVELTQSELDTRRDDLAQLYGEVYDLEEEKRQSAADFRERIKSKAQHMKRIAKEIRERHVKRTVECAYERDFDHNVVRIVRLDTHKVIESRAMTAEERQQELRLEDQAAEKRSEGDAEATEGFATIGERIAADVLELVADEPLAQTALEVATETPPDVLEPILERLVEEGKLSVDDEGRYRAVAQDEEGSTEETDVELADLVFDIVASTDDPVSPADVRNALEVIGVSFHRRSVFKALRELKDAGKLQQPAKGKYVTTEVSDNVVNLEQRS